METTQHLWMLVTVLALFTVVVSCTLTAPMATPAPPTPPPTATGIPLPPTYTPVANTTAPQLVGAWVYITPQKQQWELDLLADGTWHFKLNNYELLNGVYTVKGDQFLMTDNQDKGDSCPPDTNPGVYKWAVDGKALTLTLINDTCKSRNGTWSVVDRWMRQ
jgi:hypothetical protein